MTLKLNPHQQLLWKTPFEAQIGFGKKQVNLSELSLAQEKFIDALYQGIAPNQVSAVANQSKLAIAQAQKLVEQLEPLMLKRLANPQHESIPLEVDRAFAEIVRASLNTSSDGEAVLLARASRVVYIEKLDSTGLTLLNALAAAGVGTVITDDSSAVLNKDVSAAGFPQSLLGKKRVAAAQLMLEASHSKLRLIGPARIRPKHFDGASMAFISAQQIIDPKAYSRWVNRQAAHIAVVYDAVGAWVSGTIRAGKTPCLYCEQISKLNSDASWAAVGAQLISSTLRFDDQSTRLLAVGLAVQEMLTELDRMAGFGQEPEHRGFRIDREAGTVSELSWAQQSDCSCQLLTK